MLRGKMACDRSHAKIMPESNAVCDSSAVITEQLVSLRRWQLKE